MSATTAAELGQHRHEVGKQNDQLLIVSDYVHGVTLADWLTGRRLTPKETAELHAKIADAVHYLAPSSRVRFAFTASG